MTFLWPWMLLALAALPLVVVWYRRLLRARAARRAELAELGLVATSAPSRRSTVPAILMLLLIVATFHHAQLGLQVVIEDYVHQPALRVTSLILVKLGAAALGLAAAFAVLKIAFGG